MQPILHYLLHFGLPLFIAWLFFKKDWKIVFLILIATMLVDLDHIFADPIFQANRCSIHYHPLHSYYVMPFYVALLFLKKPYNIIGLGLVLHMLTDLTDCMLTYANCPTCLSDAPALALVRFLASTIGL